MRRMINIRSVLALFLSLPVLAFSQVEVLGTVVDAGSELPVPKVRIFSADSTFLGSSNDQGRWELRLKYPLEVTFRKEGYRDQVLALAELSDLLDVSVELEPMGTALEGRVVKGKGTSRVLQVGSIVALEQVGGMRMDLQEHLRNLPGVSGVREFSSEISVYGSRTHDVSHVLGPFQIPNLRHLDFSFPGNQSVLNPRVLQGITVEHDPTKGPLEQGLASALRYQPLRPSMDRYDMILSWGLTNRELDVFGPIGNGTFTASGRWLSPDLLNHMASRFFVGARDEDASSPAKKDTTAVAKIDLQAFDGYARVEQAFGPFAVSATVLGSSDDHTVSLYANRAATSPDPNKPIDDNFNYIDIQRGSKQDLVLFTEMQGELSSGWLELYGGATIGTQAMQLSDTTQRDATVDPTTGNFIHEMDWSATALDRSDWRLGGTYRLNQQVLGMEPEILAAVDWIDETRQFGRYFRSGLGSAIEESRGEFDRRVFSDDLAYARSRSSLRLRGKQDKMEWGLAAGGLWTQDAGWGTEATASWMAPYAGFGWLANASLRAGEASEAVKYGEYGVRQILSKEVKVGIGRALGPVELSSTVYWRGIDRPELPKADFLWILPYAQRADEATVWGGTLQAKWTSWHPLQIQSNLSRVQGDYSFANGSTMEWEANRGFDAWTVVRYHPRADTMISVILSHAASLGKPYYSYLVDTSGKTISVRPDPAAPEGAKVRDQYRTDVRAELQVPTNLKPFQQIRFYAEVQNLFGQFEADWSRYLGGNNYRARSWNPVHANGAYGKIVGVNPLYASGTDLFFSFGIEARLGI